MSPLAYIVAMWLVGAVPPHVSAATYTAARIHGQDEVVLGAYLISEHGKDWTPDPTACSSAGACGPFQLTALWPREFGYHASQRGEIWPSANMAAQLLEYSQESHSDCPPGHDYRSHLKAGPGGRDGIGWIVDGWMDYEVALRGHGGE